MSMGGHSFHKKDWEMLAAITGLGAAGAGAAGVGPLAGLLGSAAPADAAASMVGPAAEGEFGAFGMGDKGLGLAADATGGGFTGGPTGMRIPGLLPSLGGGMKNARMAQLGGGLLMKSMQPQQMPAPMGPRPGMGQQVSNTQLYQPQMPVELQALPPNDPQVIAWKKQNGIQV